MVFETFTQAQSFLLWSTFAIALVMGAMVNKTNFCTMGAVSDWVNMGDTGRMRAWLFAIAIAVLGVAILEKMGLANTAAAFPPYRANPAGLTWAENLLGGLMFGIGMTLASGCGNKTLIRIGGGNIKSIMVLIIIATIAYFMVNPFPGTDKTLMSVLFIDWIRPLALKAPQDLGSLVSTDNAAQMRLIIGGIIGLALVVIAFKSSDFRGSFDNVLGGLIVGLAVVAAWYVSSNIFLNIDNHHVSVREAVSPTAEYWDMFPEFHPAMEAKPDGAPLSPQSFTFINPMGQTLGYVANGFNRGLLTFGIMALFGVIAGSFLWSVITRSFRIEWFASFKDFVNHFIGAILMGFGGVLAMGCTIGQGVTGISTLAVGSIITFVAIVLGCAITMKIQYYKMVYEDDATFLKAFITALVDLKLLPAGLRQLEAV